MYINLHYIDSGELANPIVNILSGTIGKHQVVTRHTGLLLNSLHAVEVGKRNQTTQ